MLLYKRGLKMTGRPHLENGHAYKTSQWNPYLFQPYNYHISILIK